MKAPPLACTVRACGLPLSRTERAFTCPRGHAFDLARPGYVNLLQPQDRRARIAGDSKAAVEARAALLADGVGRALIDDVASRVCSLRGHDRGVIVDLGCGSGDALAAVVRGCGAAGVGIDLSVAAIERAARRRSGDPGWRACTWVIANADRRLPLLDQSVATVLSLHGRRNPIECARILERSGHLVVALPSPDDLVELRAAVHGRGVERDRAASVLAEHATHFTLEDRWSVREVRTLVPAQLLRLLRGTYRGLRQRDESRVAALGPMTVTLASDVICFSRRAVSSRAL